MAAVFFFSSARAPPFEARRGLVHLPGVCACLGSVVLAEGKRSELQLLTSDIR